LTAIQKSAAWGGRCSIQKHTLQTRLNGRAELAPSLPLNDCKVFDFSTRRTRRKGATVRVRGGHTIESGAVQSTRRILHKFRWGMANPVFLPLKGNRPESVHHSRNLQSVPNPTYRLRSCWAYIHTCSHPMVMPRMGASQSTAAKKSGKPNRVFHLFLILKNFARVPVKPFGRFHKK